MGSEKLELSEVYEACVPQAERVALLLTGDRHLAEDLAQEAFIRAAGRFAHLRNRSAFPAYLRQTVVNLSRAYFRRLRVERQSLERLPVAELSPRTPHDQFEDRDVLWRGLSRVPFRQRAALVLRYYEDLPEDQVADVLRCSTRAVNSLVARGLATLRDHMRGDNDG